MANGNVKVTSTQLSNSFQNLITDVPDNSGNLRYGLYCDNQTGSITAARTNLTTPLQTRIQSDKDYVRVQGGDFNYEGEKGALLVQGAGPVTFDQKAEIKFTGEGDAAIQSRHSTVSVGQDFNYESTHTVNDFLVDGAGGVYFNGGGKVDMSAANTSNVGIQSNGGDVSFSGTGKTFDVKFTASNTGDLDVMAGRDVRFNIPFSTQQKGTNKRRARFSCFHHFAVVIRHLSSRPQRTPKSSTTRRVDIRETASKWKESDISRLYLNLGCWDVVSIN